MREERRDPARLVCGAILLGLSAAVLLSAVELALAVWSFEGFFESRAEELRFFASGLGLMAAGGALVGLAEGLVGLGIAVLSRRLGTGGASVRWTARLAALVAAPPVGWGAAQVFRGPRARTIPGHSWWTIGIALGGVVAVYLAARALLALHRLATRRRILRAAGALGAALLCLVCYRIDQWVLPRLYGFFHLGMGALSFAAAQLAVALALAGVRIPWMRLGAVLSSAAALGGGWVAAGSLDADPVVRLAALEHTVLEARLVRVLARAGTRAPAADRAIGGVGEPKEAAGARGPYLGPVDVYLITIDAMRADRLRPEVAPELSTLGGSGVVFERAYAQVPHTSFSIATLLTGKYVYALSQLGLDAAGHETLPVILRRDRYKTAGFYPPAVFYIDRERLRALEASSYGLEYVKYEYLDAAARTDQVIRFLEEEQPERAFVWVHYFEPHEPYQLHPGTGPAPTTEVSAVDRYDGEVRFVDAQVGRLLAYLREHRPHGLVVVAADHGEEFGEHGGNYHGTTLFEEQIRVPLAFATVDGRGLVPGRVAGPVGLVDVAPTVLALLGVPASLRMRGRDLGPWMGPQPPGAERLGPTFSELGVHKAIVLGQDKLVCDLPLDACAYYDLEKDPGERRGRDASGRGAELRARLHSWMAAETRFEQGSDGVMDPRLKGLLERARRRDRTVSGELIGLVSGGELQVRREAALLLVRLPEIVDEAQVLAQAARSEDPILARWARIGAARLGDARSRAELAEELPELCAASHRMTDPPQPGSGDAAGGAPAEVDPGERSEGAETAGSRESRAQALEACGRGALALGEVAWLDRALEGVRGRDEALELELVRALGASGDARALDPLLVALAGVRIRLQVVRALGVLDDPGAVPTLSRWIGAEPYIPVRAEMARVLGQLASRDPSKRALAALRALEPVEKEAPVRAAITAALGRGRQGGKPQGRTDSESQAR